jgi:hypothetical protein
MTNQITKAYDDQFKKWQAPGMSKLLGPKPTAEQLLTYHRLGARHGKQCFAGAMALREHGVTGTEITIACGAPQLNKMRGFIVDALVKRVAVGKRDGSEIYKLTLTPKGEKRIATAIAREQAAEAAGAVTEPVKAKKATKVAKKAKATSKPRKPATAKPDMMTAANATATVNEAATVAQAPANGLSGDQPADTATNL